MVTFKLSRQTGHEIIYLHPLVLVALYPNGLLTSRKGIGQIRSKRWGWHHGAGDVIFDNLEFHKVSIIRNSNMFLVDWTYFRHVSLIRLHTMSCVSIQTPVSLIRWNKKCVMIWRLDSLSPINCLRVGCQDGLHGLQKHAGIILENFMLHFGSWVIMKCK